MVARRAAASSISSADFPLRNTLEIGQVKHFLCPYRQTGEGFRKKTVVQYDRIAAKVENVTFIYSRYLEIFICCA